MTDTTSIAPRPHTLARRLTAAALLLLAGAMAIVWAWNTIAPDLAGVPPIRFAEGVAFALAALLSGALFELGRSLVAR